MEAKVPWADQEGAQQLTGVRMQMRWEFVGRKWTAANVGKLCGGLLLLLLLGQLGGGILGGEEAQVGMPIQGMGMVGRMVLVMMSAHCGGGGGKRGTFEYIDVFEFGFNLLTILLLLQLICIHG